MTDEEIELLLKERVKSFDLKKTAFDTLNKIFADNSDNADFLGGFKQEEIISKFDKI